MADYIWEFETPDGTEKYLAKGDNFPDTLVKPDGSRISGNDLADRLGVTPAELMTEKAITIISTEDAPEAAYQEFGAEGFAALIRNTEDRVVCPDCGAGYLGKSEIKELGKRYGPLVAVDIASGTHGATTVAAVLKDYSEDPSQMADVLGLEKTGETEDGEPKIRCNDCRSQVYP